MAALPRTKNSNGINITAEEAVGTISTATAGTTFG